ncbi:hypothetical protein EVAR_61802_1 [Eumeta japonica]|uniref:Uncharacterized protein n=1 Tax=Eumeta variegata TaxID=151549 RepID=A0A4C1Z1A5_EUMVA|nr:hypothetical protein EVAR_61802_1 [Eumeta japonica]
MVMWHSCGQHRDAKWKRATKKMVPLARAATWTEVSVKAKGGMTTRKVLDGGSWYRQPSKKNQEQLNRISKMLLDYLGGIFGANPLTPSKPKS